MTLMRRSEAMGDWLMKLLYTPTVSLMYWTCMVNAVDLSEEAPMA